ncbi:MAG TPA: ABC transporter permease, partial [Rhodospirillales bacterium]|nr:ABC transporter permease [Rhodospirillales bacterium]
MLAYLIRRLFQAAITIVVMAVLVFVGIYAIGNPVDVLISPEADPAEIEAAIRRLGLDQPLWRQFLLFVGNALRGDLGTSFVHNEPALRLILERMPATLELAVAAMLLAVFVGIPLGMIAGLRHDRPTGRGIMAAS